MQLIRPTSEFKVGHLPFQGKVKGILPRWGKSKPSASLRTDIINCDVLSLVFSVPSLNGGRYPYGILLRGFPLEFFSSCFRGEDVSHQADVAFYGGEGPVGQKLSASRKAYDAFSLAIGVKAPDADRRTYPSDGALSESLTCTNIDPSLKRRPVPLFPLKSFLHA